MTPPPHPSTSQTPPPTGDPDETPTPSPRPARRAHFTLTNLTNLQDEKDGYRSGSSTRDPSPEPLQTPTLSQSMTNLRRNLSLSSLRELEARELRRAVWREGEKKARRDHTGRRHRPGNLEEAFAHAVRGGLRESSSGRMGGARRRRR